MSNKFDMQRAREICEKATPGPWSWGVDCENAQDGSGTGTASNDLEITDHRGCTLCTFLDYAEYENTEEDADFIAEARSMLPAALDRIEELEKALIEERAKHKTGAYFWAEAPISMKTLYLQMAREQLEKEGIL